MSERHVVVLGAGIAGAAAAWALARGEVRVSVVHDRAGSSALSSGAVDGDPATGDRALDDDARAFADALGLFTVGPTTLATREGVVRAASGADRALLDLGRLAGKHIAVTDVPRDDWDAPLLVQALAASPWAERTGTRFSLVAVSALRRGHERRITSHDFAALHDTPERIEALAALLEDAKGEHDAWLVGPWLGTEPGTAARLSRLVSVPVGETTSLVGGAAGARFENARDQLFAALPVDVRRGRVVALEPRGERFAIRIVGDEIDATSDADELEADAVVLATGGVAAGGVVFVWDPVRGAHGFGLPFDAPVALSLDGEPADRGGSLYGTTLETRGLGVLERVGVHAGARGAVFRTDENRAGLFVAGDALAARPRTVLEAVRSGIEAARGALLLGHA